MAMSFETMTICAAALIVGRCGFRGFVRFCACGAGFAAKGIREKKCMLQRNVVNAVILFLRVRCRGSVKPSGRWFLKKFFSATEKKDDGACPGSVVFLLGLRVVRF